MHIYQYALFATEKTTWVPKVTQLVYGRTEFQNLGPLTLTPDPCSRGVDGLIQDAKAKTDNQLVVMPGSDHKCPGISK